MDGVAAADGGGAVVAVAFVGGEVDLFEEFGFVVFEFADFFWGWVSYLFWLVCGMCCVEDLPILTGLKRVCLILLLYYYSTTV